MTWGFIVLGLYLALAVPFGVVAWALARTAAKADERLGCKGKEDDEC